MFRDALIGLFIGIAISSNSYGVAAAAADSARHPVTPAFQPLAPGAVEPQGWLRDWAVSMRNGMTGHLDEYDSVFQSGWLGQRLGTTGEDSPGEGWSLEQAAYWIDGAVRLGHVLHDVSLLEKILPRLEKIAGAENRNGSYLWWRDKFSWDGTDGAAPGEFNLWSCGVLGRALIAQYQATGDRKWLACIERFFATMPSDRLFPLSRASVHLETLYEADRLGADPRIWSGVVDAARRLRRDDNEWSHERYWTNLKPKDAKHGVTFHELAKLPVLLFAGTGDDSFKQASLDRYRDLFTGHLQPYGVNSASERLNGCGATRATESCNVADLMWSQLWVLRILGETQAGDRIESAFFNAAPACLSRDCRMHVYYQSPNRPHPQPNVQGGNHLTNSDFSKTQKPLCCTGNLQRILPNYIIHMWMKTPDHGLAATLYGPCSVKATVADGVAVTLAATTGYPFGEDLTVAVTPARPVRFPLYLRLPGWCSQTSVRVNGADVGTAESIKGFVRVDRTWVAGDTVVIRFPMPPRVVKGRETGGSPYACVHAGPLLFARAVPEKNENESLDSGWRYALDFEDGRPTDEITVNRGAMPARWDWPYASPVTLTVPAQSIDWAPGDVSQAALPRVPVAGKGRERIELIPYGCAKFRVAMFPVTAKAWGGNHERLSRTATPDEPNK
jgi:hypothetical protein